MSSLSHHPGILLRAKETHSLIQHTDNLQNNVGPLFALETRDISHNAKGRFLNETPTLSGNLSTPGIRMGCVFSMTTASPTMYQELSSIEDGCECTQSRLSGMRHEALGLWLVDCSLGFRGMLQTEVSKNKRPTLTTRRTLSCYPYVPSPWNAERATALPKAQSSSN